MRHRGEPLVLLGVLAAVACTDRADNDADGQFDCAGALTDSFVFVEAPFSLTQLSLPSLVSGEGVLVRGVEGGEGGDANTTLQQISLPNLASLTSSLLVTFCDGLEALDAGALTTVPGGVGIEDNGALVDLDGLDALSEVGSLAVRGNASLTSLTGLHGITAVRGPLTSRSNPALPDAEVDALLSAIGESNIEGTVTVSDNGG